MKITLRKFGRTGLRGMTLVELLVVITIMVILLAVAVPQFKPALESQRSTGAARTVSMTLERARLRAMLDKRPCGVEFVRYHDGNTPNLSLQMRYIRAANDLVQINASIRVRVRNGQIRLYKFVDGQAFPWTELDPNVSADKDIIDDWNAKVLTGYSIQFGRQGRYYELSSSTSLKNPYNGLDLPAYNDTDGTNFKNAVEFKVSMPPVPLFSPPTNLPRGTVVDLQYSGFENSASFGLNFPPSADNIKGVTIMFSPAGHVHECIRYDDNNNSATLKPHGGLFYFLVGEWDRQGTDDAGNCLAEDGRNNLMTPSNTWVTLHPRTGRVMMSRMAAMDKNSTDYTDWKTDPTKAKLQKLIDPARAFAKEHYRNLGEF